MAFIPKVTKRDEQASKHINIIAHYDNDTLLDKSGKLIKIIKLSGMDVVTKDDVTLNILKNNRNNLLKNFSSEFAMYFWQVRRKSCVFPSGEFKNNYANEVNEHYKQKIQQADMFHTELYLAIMTKQPEGIINKGFSIVKQLSFTVDKKAKQEFIANQHYELNNLTRKILNTLSDYKPKLLSIYEKNGITFSESLEFLSEIINFISTECLWMFQTHLKG